jgi:hypothetical protein
LDCAGLRQQQEAYLKQFSVFPSEDLLVMKQAQSAFEFGFAVQAPFETFFVEGEVVALLFVESALELDVRRAAERF